MKNIKKSSIGDEFMRNVFYDLNSDVRKKVVEMINHLKTEYYKR